jgi:hypothetical protein
MYGRGMHAGLWWERHMEGDHWEDQEVGGWIILKWILEEQVGVVWTGLIWLIIGTNGGSCEHGNETSDSAKRWETVE